MSLVPVEVERNTSIVVEEMYNKKINIPGFLVSTTKSAVNMVLIYSEKPATVAGTFTCNQVKAAPVKLTKKRVKSGLAQAIIINSGNANACTGRQGEKDAKEMTALVAKGLKIPEKYTLICSTGIIGEPLPMGDIRNGIKKLLSSLKPVGWEEAAKAIMTTDTFPKIVFKKGKINDTVFSLLGFAKGAGMIMPNMATMLAFFLTDIAIAHKPLSVIFKKIVSQTFNRISVDGDTSTNDTALILANGYAKNHILEKVHPIFEECLFEVASELAKMIVKDGEGASKFITIEIHGAPSIKAAEKIASTLANSLLVKTAIYGGDPNWGRIMAAIGRSGIKFDPKKIDIYFGNLCLVKSGIGQGKEDEAKKYLTQKEINIKIYFHRGNKTITWYACDLTPEYVKLNAYYRT